LGKSKGDIKLIRSLDTKNDNEEIISNKKNSKGIKIVSKNIKIFEVNVNNKEKDKDFNGKNNINNLNNLPPQKEVSFKKLLQISKDKDNDNINDGKIPNQINAIRNKEFLINKNNGVSETVEYPLPKIPNININIDGSKPMDFYYPYFFKSNVIHYNQNLNNRGVMPVSNICLDLKCEMCDRLNTDNCLRCRHGFFLHDRKCVLSCPLGYVANIFEGICNLQRPNSRNIK